jgi:type IV pilus assembly protein PilB
MASPNDVFALDDLRVRTGESIIAALADAEQLAAALDNAYRSSDIETTLDDATNDFAAASPIDFAAVVQVDDGPVVRLVSALLDEAVQRGASDLHIEPSATAVALRFRVDGVLHDTSEAQLSVLRPLVSRLKVLAGLDIAQSRLPQDGRFSVQLRDRRIDVRVATVPTSAGEAVVLRLLDPQRGNLNLDALRLSSEELARFEPAFRSAQGAVFACGPTGSGKTSTLYSVLGEISTRDKSIVSVEDPVEYRFDGVKQIQINPRAGLTFPIALRSILRADPDVVLIGEVRDGETAQIAIDAAITGHLVFSTLHTTRAAAAPLRLIDMGIESYLVASALTCVVAQRLVRRLCDECATRDPAPDIALLRRLGATDTLLDQGSIRRVVGCASRGDTGYSGRRPVYEIMPVTEEIERRLLSGCSASQLEEVAIRDGMRTLRAGALALVAAGETTVSEVLRAIP